MSHFTSFSPTFISPIYDNPLIRKATATSSEDVSFTDFFFPIRFSSRLPQIRRFGLIPRTLGVAEDE